MGSKGFVLTFAAVLKGEVPGVKKQTSLFVDGLGHPTTPLKNFVGYSALYPCSPEKCADL
jgi:hypothetical protein